MHALCGSNRKEEVMKDPIDRFLERYSASYMPAEKEERDIPSPPADKPKEPKLSEQQRWDNSMRSMGWTHLVGMKKDEDRKLLKAIKKAFYTYKVEKP